MRSRFFVGIAVAAAAALALQTQVGAQQQGAGGGGGRGAGQGTATAGGGTIAPAGQAGYPTAEQYANSKEAQALVAKARSIAGDDSKLLARFENTCGPAGPQRPALERQAAGQAAQANAPVEPVRIFDNLSYFGFNSIGAWSLTTSDGIILIDALNNAMEAETIIEPSLRKLGLNPADVKYVIVGHGHGDHVGGAGYFQTKYNSRIALSDVDWELAGRQGGGGNRGRGAAPGQPAPPPPLRATKDFVVTDGQKITVGDTTVTLYITPGHTAGSLSYLIPVRYQGKPMTILMLSGANITPTRASLVEFNRALDMAKAAGAQALINGHPGLFGDELGWMDQLRKNPKGANEFVYSREQFGKFIDIMKTCAESRIVAMGL